MTRKTGLVLASLVALTLVVAGGLTYAGDSCGSSCSSKKAKNASTTSAQTKAGSTCSATCGASSASASKSDPACAAVCGTANASASTTAQPQAVTAGSSCSASCKSASTAGHSCSTAQGASTGCTMKCDASKAHGSCTGMTMNKGVFDANVYKVENGTKYAVADGKKFVVTESTPSMTVGNARFYFADANCAVSCSEMMKASAPKYTHEAAAMASIESNVKMDGDKKMATCAMSGNTFEITATTPSICKDGEKVYFCGEGCCSSFMGI